MKYSRTCMCVLVSLAITSPKRPYIQNNKIFPVKAILLETRVNDHLWKAIGTTCWGDGFIIFHCTCKFDCIFFTPIVNCATIYHIFNFELACESIRFFKLKFLVSWVKLETWVEKTRMLSQANFESVGEICDHFKWNHFSNTFTWCYLSCTLFLSFLSIAKIL